MATRLNKPLIRKFAKSLNRRKPELFNMNHFFNFNGRKKATLKNRCGTTCCVAGDFILFDGGCASLETGSFFDKRGRLIYDEALYAQKRLGLPDTELFFRFEIETPKEAAKELLKYLD